MGTLDAHRGRVKACEPEGLNGKRLLAGSTGRCPQGAGILAGSLRLVVKLPARMIPKVRYHSQVVLHVGRYSWRTIASMDYADLPFAIQ